MALFVLSPGAAETGPETAQMAQVVDRASRPEVLRDVAGSILQVLRNQPKFSQRMEENGIEAAIAKRRLIVAPWNFAEVVDEAKRLSATHTLTKGHRGFDILHVASALKLKATHFLTFDGNQKKLAGAEGLLLPV